MNAAGAPAFPGQTSYATSMLPPAGPSYPGQSAAGLLTGRVMPLDTAAIRPVRLWVPKRVLATAAALSWPDGPAMAKPAAGLGSVVVRLKGDRLLDVPDAYRDTKSTLALVVAPPGKRRPQPIPPSADWRFDLAAGCPAHCQYCYLAGSLDRPLCALMPICPKFWRNCDPYSARGR